MTSTRVVAASGRGENSPMVVTVVAALVVPFAPPEPGFADSRPIVDPSPDAHGQGSIASGAMRPRAPVLRVFSGMPEETRVVPGAHNRCKTAQRGARSPFRACHSL